MAFFLIPPNPFVSSYCWNNNVKRWKSSAALSLFSWHNAVEGKDQGCRAKGISQLEWKHWSHLPCSVGGLLLPLRRFSSSGWIHSLLFGTLLSTDLIHTEFNSYKRSIVGLLMQGHAWTQISSSFASFRTSLFLLFYFSFNITGGKWEGKPLSYSCNTILSPFTVSPFLNFVRSPLLLHRYFSRFPFPYFPFISFS